MWVLLGLPRFEAAESCKRSRLSVSTSQSRFFRFTASMGQAMSCCVVSPSAANVLAFFEKLTPCLAGIEACASSHHRSCELRALGQRVRLNLQNCTTLYLP